MLFLRQRGAENRSTGKGALVAPGWFNWDMGVFKNIPITERWRAQLRGEFFNTFPLESYEYGQQRPQSKR
jgi:hypothetical protein